MSEKIAITVGGHPAKKITIDGQVWWQKPSPVYSYVPILTDDPSSYPIYRRAPGPYVTPVYQFAVKRNDNVCGYLTPTAGMAFTAITGMTGTEIKRVEYIEVDGTQYITTTIHLSSSDSIEGRIYPTATGKNTFGAFKSSSANDNFCLYISSSSSGSYSRFNGQVKRSLVVSLNTWNVVKLDSSGSYLNGSQRDTFDPATFTTSAPVYIMNLPNSTSAKFTGRFDYVRIPGKMNLLPVKVGSTYYMFDQKCWKFHNHVGTFDGGTVIDEAIEFPEEVYIPPVALAAPGNEDESEDS